MIKQIDVIPGNNSGESFLKDIKTELGLTSTKKVVCMLQKVLCDIQETLSPTEIRTVMARLPDDQQRLFFNQSKQKPNQLSYDHLDQWVETLYREDESSTDRIFYSEINILKTLVITITKLDRVCGLLSFPGLRQSLVREIKQAAI